MKQVGIYELKTKISALVAEVEATGQAIALTKHGRVVAEIVPSRIAAPKVGMLKSPGFWVAEDFDEDSSAFEVLLADESSELPPRLMKVAEDPAPYRVKPSNS